jgi:CRP-like cAMP-binding protein
MKTAAMPSEHAPELNSIKFPKKLFTGLPSDKCVRKARPIPRSSRAVQSQVSQAPPIRWTPRKPMEKKVEPMVKVVYKAPHNGDLISLERRHQIADMILSSQPFKGKPVSKHRIVEAMLPHVPLGLAAPYISESNHHKHYQEVIYSQGEKAAPGWYFICQGQVKISRKSEQTVMDDMQRKLFAVGAFTDMSDDENNALRKPKSSEKEWDLATLGPGDYFGFGGMQGGHHVETARILWFANIIFIPMEVFLSKLQDVKDSLLQHLEASAQSRQRQFARVTALFEPGANDEKLDEKEPVRLPSDWGGKKKLDTGLSHVITPVTKVESEKRYFRSRSSDVAYAGPYGFKPGEVPQINPELVPAPSDRTAFQFLNTKETFSRPKELGSGPDLRLPPKSQTPGTRVDRLYYRLWENCTADTFKLLQRMQGLDDETLQEIAVAPASCPSTYRPMDQQPGEMLANEAAQPPQFSRVPILDLQQAMIPTQDTWPSLATDRPVTEPGRSRSARYRAESGTPTVINLSLKDTRRPMTSRPAISNGFSSSRLPAKFDVPQRSSIAVRRTVAWDSIPKDIAPGAHDPLLERATGPLLDYAMRAPMTTPIKQLKIAKNKIIKPFV